MTTWIALLRGVNVGGRNSLPMKELRALLAGFGYHHVRTHIQSGNCVFRSDERDAGEIADRIGGEIDRRFGFRPAVLVLTADALDTAIAGNPYPQGDDDPASVHLFFLSEAASGVDIGALEALRRESESFMLSDRTFYLHAPDGIGRSKLAAGIERHLAVPVTGRNLRTALKILELAKETD